MAKRQRADYKKCAVVGVDLIIVFCVTGIYEALTIITLLFIFSVIFQMGKVM